MEILLEGLYPGAEYKAQAQATSMDAQSAWSPVFYFTTASDLVAPKAPTITSWAAVGDTFVATWTAPTQNEDNTAVEDLDSYVITLIDSRAEQRSYFVPAATERFEFNRETNIGAFGLYQKSLTIRIRSIDSSGNISTTPAERLATKPAPSPVTALTATFSGSSIVATWTAPTTNADGSNLVDLKDYTVVLSASGTTITKTFVVTQTSFTLSYEDNKAIFGGPQGAVTFTVYARNATFDTSTGVAATSVNPPPAVPTGLKGAVLPDAIDLKWNGNTEDDMARYDIYGNSTASDVGATLIDDVTSPQYLHPTVAYTTDHYFAVRAVDTFGAASALSAWVGPYRPVSPFTVDTTAPPATTLTAATASRPVSEPAAVSLSWPAATADDLAGYHVRYSPNIATPVWEYHDVVDKTATSGVISGLQSEGSYIFQIRSYDSMINTSAWSASATATASKSTVPPADVSSDIKVITGGSLRSENFTEGDPAAVPPIPPAGWRLMPSGLDILTGSVNAAVVRTGQLRSSQTIAVGLPDEGQPWWVIDTEGDATFRNAKIKGKVIVGNATGGTANDVAIASANYGVTGVTGPQWAIRGDGTFDIKSGTGARVELSAAGLVGHNGTIQTFNLDSAGNLAIDGNIRAGSGNFYGTVDVAGRLEVYGGDAYVIARRGGPGGAWVMLDGRSGTDNAISSSTGNFSVNYDGVLTAQQVNVAGKITATSGNISGVLTVGDGLAGEKYLIVNGAGGSHVVLDGRTTRSYQLYAHNGTSITFAIDNNGNAQFNGTISVSQVTDGAAKSYVDTTFETPTGAQGKANNAETNAKNAIPAGADARMDGRNYGISTITNKEMSSSTVTGGTLRTAPDGQRVEISPNSGQDVRFYQSNSTAHGYIDSRAQFTSAGWRNHFQIVMPLRSGLTARPYIYMEQWENNVDRIRIHSPGEVRFTTNNLVYFNQRPYLEGVGYLETQGHGHSYPVTSVNGRTGAVSGLSESSHNHGTTYMIRQAGSQNLQSGRAATGTTTATYLDQGIGFPVAFPSSPTMTVGFQTAEPLLSHRIYSVSTTAFYIRHQSTNGSAVDNAVTTHWQGTG